jgi:predicted DNA binding CopG/RHH family protein
MFYIRVTIDIHTVYTIHNQYTTRRIKKMENKTQMVNMRYPTELLDRIAEYQTKEGITTRSQAIQELIRKGLKEVNREGDK